MSATQDEDKRRKRSLEAGREMLEMYKAKRSRKDKDGNMESGEQSDDESLHNEKSMVTEGISLRDIMHSSISISEGENTDLEELAGGVADFEELLQGKEAIFESSNAEIDYLRAGSFTTSSPNSAQSQASSTHGRDIALNHKLQELEKKLNQRDNYIEYLEKSSLKQAISARNAVAAQLNSMSSMQLNNPVINNRNLQQKIEVLETTISTQEAIIHKSNAKIIALLETIQTLEVEKEGRNAEINDYKIQINNLNEQIRLGAAEKNLNIDETLKQQRQCEARVDKIKQEMQRISNKFTTVTNANATRHQQELKELTSKNQAEIINLKAKHSEGLKILKDENKMLADRLNKELPDLESKHARQVSVFQRQLAHYKKNVEALKLENDTLKMKKLENQLNNRTLSGRFYETEKSLSRYDATSVFTVSQLEITMYKTFAEEDLPKAEEFMKREIKSGSENRHLNEQINHLQEELSKHKLSSEHFNVNSSVLKQMKTELHEMQNQLDKRIREMESAHMCGSNLSLSQPSEDVSIREQIDATRCLTPDDPSSPPMLPLDQVLKLKDKMLKHARAEEVAFKRIKDLEMQLTTMKNQNEELLAEQEILHQTASEQLFKIEAMRGRLEQHKQSAPFAQKQATSHLELQLHEATTKYYNSLEQIITDKEIELKELKAQLERANQMLAEKEAEMENFVQSMA